MKSTLIWVSGFIIGAILTLAIISSSFAYNLDSLDMAKIAKPAKPVCLPGCWRYVINIIREDGTPGPGQGAAKNVCLFDGWVSVGIIAPGSEWVTEIYPKETIFKIQRMPCSFPDQE